ncbi:MAG: hypothetical protein WBD31_29515, partial [Rubripirellula sp.]
MADAIYHRGPDDQAFGHFAFANGVFDIAASASEICDTPVDVTVGFNRLSIRDVSQAGRQPMVHAEAGIGLIYNGELYNADEHREKLKASGIKFRSGSDTEVLLQLLVRDGPRRTLDQLNGMFAFACIDFKKGLVTLARDHFGIKPLYWTLCGGELLFASEAKSFLSHPRFAAEINPDVVSEFLAFRFAAYDDTLLKNVRRLPPGHLM